jgi:hypothetical protein
LLVYTVRFDNVFAAAAPPGRMGFHRLDTSIGLSAYPS